MAVSKRLSAHRAAAPDVNAAETDPETLLAALTDDQKSALKAHLIASDGAAGGDSGQSASDDEDGDETNCPDCKAPMTDKKCAKCGPKAGADANADAFAAANARALAVMASEHFAANAALAKTLLANDKLSADEINAALAAAGGSRASAEEQDAAARAAMKEAIGSNRNSNIDAGNGGASASANQPDPSAGWAKAAARTNARYRL